MNLAFSTCFADSLTYFIGRILLNDIVRPGKHYDEFFPQRQEAKDKGFAPKLHTVRDDDNDLWKIGNLIHFNINPRKPSFRNFGVATCKLTQVIQMFEDTQHQLRIYIDHRLLSHEEAVQFAINDGFDNWEAFCKWFAPIVAEDFAKGQYGRKRKVIHWTELKY